HNINNKGGEVEFSGQMTLNGETIDISGHGNGPLSSFIDGVARHTGKQLHIINYSEHAISPEFTYDEEDEAQSDKTNAKAAAYIQLNVDGEIYSGIGTHTSTVSAMLKGALSALSQAF